ncbi:MAG: hypothetical protein QXV45_03425 [Candidatus Bathyarchaeia archaeon]
MARCSSKTLDGDLEAARLGLAAVTSELINLRMMRDAAEARFTDGDFDRAPAIGRASEELRGAKYAIPRWLGRGFEAGRWG